MGVKENLIHIKNNFTSPSCLLIAVSKTKPISAIQEAYDAGIRDFGENKVQEMAEKAPQLPRDIRWHMIGHLQRNKVKFISPFVHLIHGVDSLRLLEQINKEGQKAGRVISCLLQIHIAKEETKFGLDEQELAEILLGDLVRQMTHIRITGLMGMATNTDDEETVRKEFSYLRRLMQKYSGENLPSPICLKELSMGMSSDYLIAQEEGSTMVRIGRAIFGARNVQ
jgi:PLP dependent protein